MPAAYCIQREAKKNTCYNFQQRKIQAKKNTCYNFQDEVCLKGYTAHLNGVNAPAPLTDREEALKELRHSEHDPNYGTDSRYRRVILFLFY